jgi:hypothetical protein
VVSVPEPEAALFAYRAAAAERVPNPIDASSFANVRVGLTVAVIETTELVSIETAASPVSPFLWRQCRRSIKN